MTAVVGSGPIMGLSVRMIAEFLKAEVIKCYNSCYRLLLNQLLVFFQVYFPNMYKKILNFFKCGGVLYQWKFTLFFIFV